MEEVVTSFEEESRRCVDKLAQTKTRTFVENKTNSSYNDDILNNKRRVRRLETIIWLSHFAEQKWSDYKLERYILNNMLFSIKEIALSNNIF